VTTSRDRFSNGYRDTSTSKPAPFGITALLRLASATEEELSTGAFQVSSHGS
jgi:hypothetical protein